MLIAKIRFHFFNRLGCKLFGKEEFEKLISMYLANKIFETLDIIDKELEKENKPQTKKKGRPKKQQTSAEAVYNYLKNE